MYLMKVKKVHDCDDSSNDSEEDEIEIQDETVTITWMESHS